MAKYIPGLGKLNIVLGLLEEIIELEDKPEIQQASKGVRRLYLMRALEAAELASTFKYIGEVDDNGVGRCGCKVIGDSGLATEEEEKEDTGGTHTGTKPVGDV